MVKIMDKNGNWVEMNEGQPAEAKSKATTQIPINGIMRDVFFASDGTIRNPVTNLKINPMTGEDIPDQSPQTAPAPTQPQQQKPAYAPCRFLWKGELREVLANETDPRIASAPYRTGVQYLVKEFKAGKQLLGYTDFQRAIDANTTMATFGPLGAIQKWCRRNGFFDLSAIVVSRTSRVPGSGHYVNDTHNEAEWREYIRLAAEAVKQ
ncbi:MAG: hypothetical protein HQM16_17895 [Deltaproteobacteria bacterium]|nr:hypothetical protein [Deltaproteobacteria bacterium]